MSSDPADSIQWQIDHEGRLGRAEEAIATLARAADRQQDFNQQVVGFMSSVRTWGTVALMIYAVGQALLITRLS